MTDTSRAPSLLETVMSESATVNIIFSTNSGCSTVAMLTIAQRILMETPDVKTVKVERISASRKVIFAVERNKYGGYTESLEVISFPTVKLQTEETGA